MNIRQGGGKQIDALIKRLLDYHADLLVDHRVSELEGERPD